MNRVWAVARHTIATGIRMKVVLFFVCLIAAVVLGLPFSVRGDGSLVGALQSYLTYSLMLVGALLSLQTIFMSWSISDEIAQRQILVLMTKPLARWQYVVGKWLGIVLLDATMLAAAGGCVFGMALYLASLPERSPADHDRIRTEVLAARHVSRVEVPDFTKDAAALFEQRREEGRYAERVDLIPDVEKARLKGDLEVFWRNVLPHQGRVWEFKDLRCARSPDQFLNLRFKTTVYNPPPTETVSAVWHFGDRTRGSAQYENVVGRYAIDRVHTVPIPTDAVSPDGTLVVRFENTDPFVDPEHNRTIFDFSGDHPLEVLFPVGTFGGNLVRTLALVLCRLVFLAALGIMAASVFSFPIACVCTLTFYGFLALRAFILDAFTYMTDTDWTGHLFRGIGWLVQALYMLVPDFDKHNALELFVEGRNVTLLWVIDGTVRLGLATLLVGGVACLLFYRREVSEVSI